MIGPKFLKRALIVGALGSLFAFTGNAQASEFSFWGGYSGYSRGHCYTPPRGCYGGYDYGYHSYRPYYRSYRHDDRGRDWGYRHHGFSGHRGFDHSWRYKSRGWCR